METVGYGVDAPPPLSLCLSEYHRAGEPVAPICLSTAASRSKTMNRSSDFEGSSLVPGLFGSVCYPNVDVVG